MPKCTHHIPLYLAGTASTSWSDKEVRSLLQEWEALQREVGHSWNTEWKAKVISDHLQVKGVSRNWDACLHFMKTMKYVHWILCNERPKSQPLFCPHAEALYRILGYPQRISYFPGMSLLCVPYILLVKDINRHSH